MAKYLDATGLGTLWSTAKNTFYYSGNSNKTDVNWTARTLTLNGPINPTDMASSAIYGLYLNSTQSQEDGYRAAGDNGYIQVPMISGNHTGYLYTALLRFSTGGGVC